MGRGRTALFANCADQGFGCVGRFFPGDSVRENAGSLDGVNQPEDIGDRCAVGRILLKMHDLRSHLFKVIGSLRKEIVKQFFHVWPACARHRLVRTSRHLAWNGLREA